MIKIINADGKKERTFITKITERSQKINLDVSKIVTEIIENVRKNGDSAVLEYTRKFDCSSANQLTVPKEEIYLAYKNADPNFVAALERAAENIRKFHQKQLQHGFSVFTQNGSMLGQNVRPLERVALYVPGGTAAYPSSVLMNAIPAKIAGVPEIIILTPPTKDGTINPDILTAAAICGIENIFSAGGAQAIAAAAYGTENIQSVDKIVGPGNIFVATAKKMLYGVVDIDMIAGPSEILIIADETANPKFLAADLMGQAEHDKLASAILLTTSRKIADETIQQLSEQIKKLERKEIIKHSLNEYGAIIVFDNQERLYEVSNKIAPEHLEIITKNPIESLGKIKNAGSVFLGEYSPEALGDYYAGPNHVLPTNGTARFSSPLSVDDFIKKFNYIYYNKEALAASKDDILTIAQKESLSAHYNSVKVRF